MSVQKINHIVNTRYGSMIYNLNDQIIGKSLELYGEWSQNELDFIEKYISNGDICLDVGANIGTHTLFFANQVGKHGRVVAFEPQRIVFQLLCANISLNHYLNVSAFNYAATSQQQMIHISNLDPLKPNNFGAAKIQGRTPGTIPVEGIPLDFLMLPRLNFLKIDAEGSEPEVIMGALQLIKKHQPLIYVEYYPSRHSKSLVDLIHSLNYRIYIHGAPSFNLSNFNKEINNIFGEYVEHSLFCVPKTRNVDIPQNVRAISVD